MIPVIVSTVGSPALPVFESSLAAYAPTYPARIYTGSRGNFGDDYNHAMAEAFQDYDEILIANDDIVLTPSTLPVLMQDVEMLKKQPIKLGVVGVRSDSIRPFQNIVQNDGQQVREVPVVSPILAYVPKAAFEAARFPPLNWYSDDVWCLDLMKQGFRHFVSRAYVHHAGSTTIGHDAEALRDAAKPWILEHRSEYAPYWGMA